MSPQRALPPLVTQLLTIRECIAQFSGNEFVINLILFIWLFIGGIGNRAARLTNKFLPATKSRLAWISIGIAVLPALLLHALRGLRDIVFIHGSNVGFYPTFAFIFFCLAPYCLLVGISLPYGLFVLKKYDPEYPGTPVYLMDNLGNVIGGVLFSFVLIFFTTPMQSVFIVGALLLVCVCIMVGPPPTGKWSFVISMFIAVVILATALFLETASLPPGEGTPVYYKESRFGRILVTRDREQYTLYEDGSPVFFSEDIPVAEETIHYPLCQVENPQNILLISARSGMMDEIEKYHPDSIDYVELNPDISAVLVKYGLIHGLNGTYNIINRDGRAFLRQTDKLYDAIIVNLPDPSTFQINRFFTDRFFLLAKNHLTSGGILSFSIPGYDNYVSEPLRQKISSLYNTVSDYFSYVTLLPGNNIVFLCANRPIHTDIPRELLKKGISTLYISRYYYGNLTSERIREINDRIDPLTRKNEDLSPHLIKMVFREWFSLHQTSPWGFMIGAACFIMVYLLIMGKAEFTLFTTGFASMGSEILTIFAVQVFFGYIYSQIGLIVTVFLAGLFPGAWIGAKWIGDKRRLLLVTDGVLMALLLIFAQVVRIPIATPSLYFFMLFGFLISLACGCQFPLALSLIKDNESGAVKSFSADLFGAAVGTLVTSLLFIPVLGIIGSVWALIGLKGLSLIRLLFRRHPV